MKNTTTIVS